MPTKHISARSQWQTFLRVIPTRWLRKPADIENTLLSPIYTICIVRYDCEYAYLSSLSRLSQESYIAYSARLAKMPQLHRVRVRAANTFVFCRRLNVSASTCTDMLPSRSVAGRLFHTASPLYAKQRSATSRLLAAWRSGQWSSSHERS